MDSELTICSVNHRQSQHLLANLDLTRRLNPKSALKWLIVDNSPEEDCLGPIWEKYGESTRIVTGRHNAFREPGRGSKHHASGLNLLSEHVKSRFVLIVDPDFYITMPLWVNQVLGRMSEKQLALFGVPWHPRWRSKFRYFPSIHCLFIDSAQIPLSKIDFMPDFQEHHSLSPFRQFIMKIPLLRKRALIAQSKDTGYRIYEKYHQAPEINFQLVTPSFTRKDLYNMYHRTDPQLLNIWIRLNRALDFVFPETLSMFPKIKSYYTRKSFAASGFYDCKRNGWEEFFFEGRPFGFHVRGIQQKLRHRKNELDLIGSALKTMAAYTDRQERIK